MSPYHHPNEQADYQAVLDAAENAISGEEQTFLETMELIVQDEKDFLMLLHLLNHIQNEESWEVSATTLRSWLRIKVGEYARRKAEKEVQNSYWRNR
jgi:predicted DNA-binding ribbon-helix-helix protein